MRLPWFGLAGAFAVAVACENSDPRATPRCELQPGVTAGRDGFPPESALPQGDCGVRDACEIAAEGTCPCALAPGGRAPINTYRCTCTNGNWACVVTLAGGSGCQCITDAGIDTGVDAAIDGDTHDSSSD